MRQFELEWNEALKGNPLNAPTFTHELQARIKSKALSSTTPSKSRLQSYLFICIGVCCVLGIVLFTPSLFAPTIETDTQMSQILHKPLIVQPQKSEWQKIIDGQYPESHNEILQIQSYGHDKMLIFFKRLFEFKGFESFSITTSTFEWDSQQWKSRTSFSRSIGDPSREGTTEKLTTDWIGTQPFIFHGMINDPQIASIQVVIVNQDITQQAQIIRDGDRYTYWFIALQGDYYKDQFRVEGLDASGKTVISHTY
jgi:hypothetical protein